MNEPSRSAMWRWRLVAFALFYVTLTLALATLASLVRSPLVAQIAQVLPGAGLWPSLMDLRGHIGNSGFQFPTPIAALLVLAVSLGLAQQRARGIAAQIREDARIAREEVIRERERQKMRRKD